MRYVVAVSGGVDSVVLLDMLSKVAGNDIMVAHFDHGIRSDSARDEQFVASLARSYGLGYASKREELGSTASEALARERRYGFLREIAQSYNAKIVTAHHLDDLVETIAINLQRGTGWRGVAALDADIARPLLDIPKKQLINYAQANGLVWREDSTNASDAYLRNRIRRSTQALPHDSKRQLRALQSHQKQLKQDIEREVKSLVGDGPEYSRYFFAHIPPSTAIECLRYITQGLLTRPQLMRLLLAIKTTMAGSVFEAGSGVNVRFSTRHFSF